MSQYIVTSPRSRGFSLVEMSIVMILMGVVASAAYWSLPILRGAVAEQEASLFELNRAEHSVIGFALLHARLPCPDADQDGFEDCASGSTGWLPWRSLGEPELAGLRYGAYRFAGLGGSDADLSTGMDRHVPDMPPGASAPPSVNGLDLCRAVKNAQRFPGQGGLRVGGMTVAFALAAPGARDADGDGSVFDGEAAKGGFDVPGPASDSHDDVTRTVGFGQLAASLGCLEGLARANGAIMHAWAAHDEARFVAMYKDFRAYALEVREMNLVLAGVGEALAMVDAANAAATAATGVAVAAVTLGASAVGSIVGGTAAIAASVAALAAASAVLASAVKARDKAVLQLQKASEWAVAADAQALAERDRALMIDARGTHP